jgi:hypothetical protein
VEGGGTGGRRRRGRRRDGSGEKERVEETVFTGQTT